MRQLARYLVLLTGLALLTATGADGTPGDTLYVQDIGVNVYEAPSVDAPVVMRIDRGRKLKELRRRGAWVKVIIYGELGRDGWIQGFDAGPQIPGDDSPKRQKTETEQTRVPAQPVKPKTKRTADTQFLLVVTGVARTFRANCRIITKAGGRDRLKFAGSVPKTYLLYAKAVSCDVRKAGELGRLRVQLRHRGRIVASHSTTRSFGSVDVRSAGPWGRARALRCNNVRRRLCVE